MSPNTGFYYEALQNYGALENKWFLPPNLNKSVHSIFCRSNWDATFSNEEWSNIEPALQLASNFITEPTVLPFWFHAIHGNLEKDELGRKILTIHETETSF